MNEERKTRRIGNMIFEKVADKYVFEFSKNHIIVISRFTDRGWMAKEKILVGTGKYMNGEKHFETIRSCSSETMAEALDGLLGEI